MKKLFSILICFLMLATCTLAGCATFSIDKVKYYNEVLATVGTEKITRFDLLTAYNSYGSSYYVQQMGESEKEALSSTLDLLIDRELMYQYALDNNELYKPTKYQVNSIVEEMFNSLDSQCETYLASAKSILEIEEDDDVATEEASNKTSYSLKDYKYKPRAEVVYEDGEQKIKYITEGEPNSYDKLIVENYLTNFTEKEVYNHIKNKYFERFENKLKDRKFSSDSNLTKEEYARILTAKVKSLFADDLIDYEFYLRDSKGEKFDKITENLITRHMERTFDDKIKSQYVENMRVHYLENAQLSINDLTNEFSYLLDLDFDKYNNNHDEYGNKMKDVGTDADSVLYHPNTEAKFGYFVHALLNFDNIKENITLLENESDPEKYEEQYNSLVSNNQIMKREFDEETQTYTDSDNKVSLKTVVDEYNAIANANYSSTQEKLQAFIKFMFTYSTDNGTLSAGMPYVIGTNGYSAMEQAFTDEAIKLMNGFAGDMSEVDLTKLDEMCITPYGIHVLFYVGEVNSNDIPYQDKDAVYIEAYDRNVTTIGNNGNWYIFGQDSGVKAKSQTNPHGREIKSVKEVADEIDSIKTYLVTFDNDEQLSLEVIDRGSYEHLNLYTKKLNPLTEQTYFDMLFDYVYPASSGEVYTSNNGYTEFEEYAINQSKQTHKVKKFTTKIKGTKTAI